MLVQYMGCRKVKSEKGYKVYLGREVDKARGEGTEPVMTRGRFGLDYPYVSNERFAKEFANLSIGSLLEIDFDPATGYMSIGQ